MSASKKVKLQSTRITDHSFKARKSGTARSSPRRTKLNLTFESPKSGRHNENRIMCDNPPLSTKSKPRTAGQKSCRTSLNLSKSPRNPSRPQITPVKPKSKGPSKSPASTSRYFEQESPILHSQDINADVVWGDCGSPASRNLKLNENASKNKTEVPFSEMLKLYNAKASAASNDSGQLYSWAQFSTPKNTPKSKMACRKKGKTSNQSFNVLYEEVEKMLHDTSKPGNNESHNIFVDDVEMNEDQSFDVILKKDDVKSNNSDSMWGEDPSESFLVTASQITDAINWEKGMTSPGRITEKNPFEYLCSSSARKVSLEDQFSTPKIKPKHCSGRKSTKKRNFDVLDEANNQLQSIDSKNTSDVVKEQSLSVLEKNVVFNSSDELWGDDVDDSFLVRASQVMDVSKQDDVNTVPVMCETLKETNLKENCESKDKSDEGTAIAKDWDDMLLLQDTTGDEILFSLPDLEFEDDKDLFVPTTQTSVEPSPRQNCANTGQPNVPPILKSDTFPKFQNAIFRTNSAVEYSIDENNFNRKLPASENSVQSNSQTNSKYSHEEIERKRKEALLKRKMSNQKYCLRSKKK